MNPCQAPSACGGVVDKVKKIFYYDGRSDLLVKHLKIIGEESPKVRKQIARETLIIKLDKSSYTKFDKII